MPPSRPTDAPDDVGGDAIDHALARLERQGDEALVHALVASFLERTPRRLRDAASALDRGDPEEAARLVHMLCSSCRNLGAEEMAEECRHAEERARGGEEAAFRVHLDALHAGFERLRPRLETALPPGEEPR